MKRFNANLLWGVLLIAAGVLFLLQNMGYLKNFSAAIWFVVFLAAGIGFLLVFTTNRAHWWALIPAFVFIGLSGTIGLDTFAPRLEGQWSGAVFLGSMGIGFIAVYFARRENWWAIIPGGVMITLAVVTIADARAIESGGIFFVGLAVTFALIFLATRMRWPLLPAAVLFAIGLFIGTGLEKAINYVWPVALIVAGLYMIYRVSRRAA